MQALCQAGPQAVNKADEWGLSPLHIAARAGDADIVTMLLLAQVRWCLFASVCVHSVLASVCVHSVFASVCVHSASVCVHPVVSHDRDIAFAQRCAH